MIRKVVVAGIVKMIGIRIVMPFEELLNAGILVESHWSDVRTLAMGMLVLLSR